MLAIFVSGSICKIDQRLWRRTGLYKQLAELKNVVSEYRENPAQSAALKSTIIELLSAAGLEQDCPFHGADGQAQQLSPEAAAQVDDDTFAAYASELMTYLQVWLYMRIGVPQATSSCSQMPDGCLTAL